MSKGGNVEAKLKQRIVGITVLVIAALIILPFLLHRPNEKKTLSVAVPVENATEQAPASKPAPIAEPTIITAQAPAATPTPQPVIAAAPSKPKPTLIKTVAAKKATVKKVEHHKRRHHKKSVIAKAWTVQLASFSNKENAKRLIHKLRHKGFHAYERTTKTKKGRLVRVFVGPEIRKHDAKKILVKLRKQFHLKGLITEYHV